MTRAARAKKFGRRGLLARQRPHKPACEPHGSGPRPAENPRVATQRDALDERKQMLRARLAAFQVVMEHLGAAMEEIRARLHNIEEIERE